MIRVLVLAALLSGCAWVQKVDRLAEQYALPATEADRDFERVRQEQRYKQFMRDVQKETK